MAQLESAPFSSVSSIFYEISFCVCFLIKHNLNGALIHVETVRITVRASKTKVASGEPKKGRTTRAIGLVLGITQANRLDLPLHRVTPNLHRMEKISVSISQ